MSVTVEWNVEDLQKSLEGLVDHLDDKIERIFRENEAWAVAWMKTNAPWTDNTGRARAELGAKSNRRGHIHEMILFGGAPYQVWLEVANSGRFQILGPAMRHVAAKLLQDLQHLMDTTPAVGGGGGGRQIPPQARKMKPNTNKSGSRRSRKAYGRRRNR
jgi:hypothetical protein